MEKTKYLPEYQVSGDQTRPASDHHSSSVMGTADGEHFTHSWRIISIIILFSLISFISGLDSSIITTSLPTITREIGGANLYAWVANSYLFASTVPQPLYAQVSNVFGRRKPFFFSVALFFLGSGLAGGARNAGMLIAARVVQGLGSGGIYVLPEIILCDLVPPRHRGPYLSVVLSSAAIATTVGPIIGGVLAESDWRWIFYLNLPVVGVALVLIALLLRIKPKRHQTWREALLRIDFLGNAIFIPSMLAIFFGLIMGSSQLQGYSWRSPKVIVPLILGALGWIVFHIHQASPVCREPSIPPRLFQHRTSAVGYLMIFLAATYSQATSFFLPVYFQAVRGVSPLMSGVYYLPFAIALLILAGLAGAFLSKTGLYRPVHWAGWALGAIGAGLLSTLDEKSTTGSWIGFQILSAGGIAFIFTVSLPSTLAALAESDVAVATGTYAFVRTFGFVWGVTISAITFNSQVNTNLATIVDPAVRELFADGAAYAYTSSAQGGMVRIEDLPEPSRGQVLEVYVRSLRIIWIVFATISAVGFFSTFVESHIELRKNHETEFALIQASDAGGVGDGGDGTQEKIAELSTGQEFSVVCS